MRWILLPCCICVSFLVHTQIIPDSAAGLQPYFNTWYKEAKGQSKGIKKRKGIERAVLSLYLFAVNGGTDSLGNRIMLERLVPPEGSYSLVQNRLNYRVVERFPSVPKNTAYYGGGDGWQAVVDSLRSDNTLVEHIIEPLQIDPDLFRVKGLPLSVKQEQEIQGFLESDTSGQKEMVGGVYVENPNGMIRGQNFRLLGDWVTLIQPHWGTRWIYKSFPIISDVIIESGAKQALLTYHIHNGGGYAHFKKTKTGWVLTESRITIMQ